MLSLRKLWAHSWGTIVHPTRTFEAIVADGSLVYSTVVMVLFGLLYSLLCLLIYARGQTPSLPILIAVPPEKFYLGEAIYFIPFTLQFWVLFSALCHLFAGRKRGNFDATFAVMGFSNAIPNIVMFWIPDFISFVTFGDILTVPVAIYGSLWLIWLVWLSGIGLKVTHKIPLWKGVSVALIAFLLHLTIGFFFIR
jgi:hypothetical protein